MRKNVLKLGVIGSSEGIAATFGQWRWDSAHVSHLLSGSFHNRLLWAGPEPLNYPDQPHLGSPHTCPSAQEHYLSPAQGTALFLSDAIVVLVLGSAVALPGPTLVPDAGAALAQPWGAPVAAGPRSLHQVSLRLQMLLLPPGNYCLVRRMSTVV